MRVYLTSVGVFSALFLGIFMTSISGCGGSMIRNQAKAASAMGETVNFIRQEMRKEYDIAQDRAFYQACEVKPCAERAAAAVEEVIEKWQPVWSIHDAVRAAHDAWVSALVVAVAGDSQEDTKKFAELVNQVLAIYQELTQVYRSVTQGKSLPQPPKVMEQIQ